MPVEIRRATEDDMPQLHLLDRRNFGVADLPTEDELSSDLLDPDRFLVGVDGPDLVAAAGSFAMELTLPSEGTDPHDSSGRPAMVPMSGVTWVSVAASHRRQGILRQLMAGLDELAIGCGEPCLGLTASEGPIYERFGYGVATQTRVVEIDRRRAQIDPRWSPEPVRLVEAADHVDQLRRIYDRYRANQPGEVSRSEALFRAQTIENDKANFAAVHPDGYAVWTVDKDWQYGHPNHSIFVRDLIAVTPEAYLALWHLLLSIDLVGPIRSIRTASADDPLPRFLTDPRALRTVELNDGVWLKLLDPVRCFGARSYRTDDRLVIEVRDQADRPRFGIGNSGCTETDDPADIAVDRSTLGPLLLGVSPSQLAAGRRLEADRATLVRADLLFGTGIEAHNRTGF